MDKSISINHNIKQYETKKLGGNFEKLIAIT